MIIFIDPTTNPTKIKSYTNKNTLISEMDLADGRNQTEELLVKIDELLAKNRETLEAIFVNITAGSYTSVRVGITVANFLGFSLNIQPRGVFSENEVKFEGTQKFSHPLLPIYGNEPVVTPKKDRL